MTVQIPETLICENTRRTLLSEPLADYFTLGGRNPGLRWQSTACWRGYVGTWELCNKRLYLIALADYLSLSEGRSSNLSLATLFPEYPHRVFAHWYWGTLRIPMGRRLGNIGLAFHDNCERTLLLRFERGVLLAASERHNDGKKMNADTPMQIAEAVALLDASDGSVEVEI